MLDLIQDPKFIIEITVPKVQILIGAPTKRDYMKMITGNTTAEEMIKKYGIYAEMLPMTESTGEKFIDDYITALKEYREKNADLLAVPEKVNFSGKSEYDIDFPILTHADNMVYQHSGLTIMQQTDISIVEYWLLLADAVKIKLCSTEKGREYLHDCYMDMHKISTIKPNI